MTIPMIIRSVFIAIAGICFAIGAWVVIHGATHLPEYTPSTGAAWLLNTSGAAVIAFIATQLGIAVGASASGRTFAANLNVQVGSIGTVVLILVSAIFMVAGVIFVYLYTDAGAIAVKEGAPQLKDSPEYIGTQAKLFFGVVAAAAVAGSSS